MRKWITRIGIVLVIGLLIVVVLNWSLIRQIAIFSPIILPRLGSGPSDEAEARLQDIEYLARLLKYDRSFDEAERTEFEALIANRKSDAESMSDAQLLLLTMEAAAIADNGHSSGSLSPVRTDFNNVGVRYFIFQDGLYVVRALAEYETLIGGRVLEIDGQPIDSIMTALNIYTGGVERWREQQSLILLESAEILHAAGLVDSPTGYTLTVVDQLENLLQIELVAYTPEPGDAPVVTKSIRNLDARPLPDEGDGWMTALLDVPAEDLPLYLQQTTQLYMWEPLPGDGGYIRVQNIWNSNEQTMSAFFEENIKPLPDGSLRYLVVDLRANDAADFTLFVEPAKWLPGKVADDGHLYILVGPQTFSTGINCTALLKYYGGEKSVIVGEPMGDREQYWGERGLPFRLPNSGFQVGYATGYHDWANGCQDHPYCYTLFLKHGVAAGSLAPSQIIEPNYADYAAGRDVVMEWVYEQELP